MEKIEVIKEGVRKCLSKELCRNNCPYAYDGCTEKLQKDVLEALSLVPERMPEPTDENS